MKICIGRLVVLGMAAVLYGSLAQAAPLVQGSAGEALGRTTSWRVYAADAPDNPLPAAGLLTYVYNVSATGTMDVPVFGVHLNALENRIVTTTTAGSGESPDRILPGVWQWWFTDGTPTELQPGESTLDLIVTSPFQPGPITADVYSCNPLVCTIATTPVVGPVPEPSGLILGAAALAALWRRRPPS